MAEQPPKKESRLVQIGFNLISLLDVNDKEHSFTGNCLMGTEFFKPWIQLHNIKSCEEIFNEGMTEWRKSHLAERVKKMMAEKPNDPVNVMESRNFVATFVSQLNLRNFPFDQQDLRITIMSNTTSDVTFSHKVARDPKTKEARPLMTATGEIITAIKCNLEADTLSEWDVLLQSKQEALESVVVGKPAPAVVCYDFQEHDKAFSAEGAVYQRLDFFVYVERELKNMMFTIILPTCMLSASSLCVFSLDITTDPGDRFGVLFTVVLTIVANQFVTQGRLPYLAYFTWMDGCMLFLQVYVYCIIVETASCTHIAALMEMDPNDVDNIALWVMIGLYLLGLLIMCGTGLSLFRLRKRKMQAAQARGKDSFKREELRLRKLWFPEQFAAENRAAAEEANHVVVNVSN